MKLIVKLGLLKNSLKEVLKRHKWQRWKGKGVLVVGKLNLISMLKQQ